MQPRSKRQVNRSTAALIAAVASVGFTTVARATQYTCTAFEGAQIEPVDGAYEDDHGVYWQLRGAANTYPTWGVLDFNAGALGIPQGEQVQSVNSDLTMTLYQDDYEEPATNENLTVYLATDTNPAEVASGATTLLYETSSTYPGGLNAPGQAGSFASGTQLWQIGTGTYITNAADGSSNTFNLTLNSAQESYIQGQINTGNTVRIVVTTAETDSGLSSFYGSQTSSTQYLPQLTVDVNTTTASSNTSKLYVSSNGTKSISVNVGTYLTDHGTPQYCVLQGGSATTQVTLLNGSTTSGDNLTYTMQTNNASASVTSPGPDPIVPGGTAQATVGFGPADSTLEAGNTITGTVTISNSSNYENDTTPVTVNINPALVLQERYVDSAGKSSAAPNVGKVLVNTTGTVSVPISTVNPVNLTDYSNDALTTVTLNANVNSTPYAIYDYFTKATVATISATSPSYSQTFNSNNSGTVTGQVAVAISGQYGNNTPVVEGTLTQTYAPNYTTFGQADITGDGLQGEDDEMDVYLQWQGYQAAAVTGNGTVNSGGTATLTNAASNDNIYTTGGTNYNNGLRATAWVTGVTITPNSAWSETGFTAVTTTGSGSNISVVSGTVVDGTQTSDDFNNYTANATVNFNSSNQITPINGTYSATMTVYLENEQDIQGSAPNDLAPVVFNLQTTITSNPSVESGAYTFTGGTLVAPATDLTGSFTQTGGKATFASISGTGTLNIGNGGTAGLASHAGGPGTPSSVGSLNITGNSTFDISDNKLYIDYGSGSDPMSTIYTYLKNGYNNGNWNGTGGIITSAPLTYGGFKYSLGFADGANDHGVVAGLASGQIELMYTLVGDATLAGQVTGTDLTIVAINFNQPVTGWDQGDFNYGTLVSGADLTLLAENFNQEVSNSASAGDVAALDAFAAANRVSLPTSSSSVPEPASAALLLMAGLGIRRRRRMVK